MTRIGRDPAGDDETDADRPPDPRDPDALVWNGPAHGETPRRLTPSHAPNGDLVLAGAFPTGDGRTKLSYIQTADWVTPTDVLEDPRDDPEQPDETDT